MGEARGVNAGVREMGAWGRWGKGLGAGRCPRDRRHASAAANRRIVAANPQGADNSSSRIGNGLTYLSLERLNHVSYRLSLSTYRFLLSAVTSDFDWGWSEGRTSDDERELVRNSRSDDLRPSAGGDDLLHED